MSAIASTLMRSIRETTKRARVTSQEVSGEHVPNVRAPQLKRLLYQYPAMSTAFFWGGLGVAFPFIAFFVNRERSADTAGRLAQHEAGLAEDRAEYKARRLAEIEKIRDENVKSQMQHLLHTHPRFNPQH